MEARGLEPLTSGLQSPRSAKLSYAPILKIAYLKFVNLRQLVGLSRFELLTSRLSGVRSNQLSYRPRNRTYRKIKPLENKWLYWVFGTCQKFSYANNELIVLERERYLKTK